MRVELNPMALNKYGIGLETVRSVLSSANANVPKGHFTDGYRSWEVGANDQIFKAVEYQPLIVAYHNGSAVRLETWRAWSIPSKISAMRATPMGCLL